jgi:DMSO/TMAO reductase YedYZ molybdopterin-dependent catalytic subunit
MPAGAARLRDVLAGTNVKREAVEVAMSGADGPLLPATPKFVKRIPIHSMRTRSSYQMNDALLPHLNGFPARVIVPGWTGTYWMKQVNALEVRGKPLRWLLKASAELLVQPWPANRSWLAHHMQPVSGRPCGARR